MSGNPSLSSVLFARFWLDQQYPHFRWGKQTAINFTILESYQLEQILFSFSFFFFYLFIYFSYLRILKCCYLGWKKKKKKSFSKQLYKTGCYREVRADNPLACSEGIIQTHAGKKASEIGPVDCWDFKRVHETNMTASRFSDRGVWIY